MRPHAVPIGNALNLPGIDRLSKDVEIAVNPIGCLQMFLIEKLSGLLEQRSLIFTWRHVEKCHHIHIAGMTTFQNLNLLKKAAVQPLKT